MTGHFVWTLQKAENKIKVALDSGKADLMTEVISCFKTGWNVLCALTVATPVRHFLSTGSEPDSSLGAYVRPLSEVT